MGRKKTKIVNKGEYKAQVTLQEDWEANLLHILYRPVCYHCGCYSPAYVLETSLENPDPNCFLEAINHYEHRGWVKHKSWQDDYWSHYWVCPRCADRRKLKREYAL